MRSGRSTTFFVGLSLLFLTVLPNAHGDSREDEDRLAKDLGGADVERVLNYLQTQVPSAETEKRIQELIDKMGSPTFKVRQDATKKIIEAGQPALPQLRFAINHMDKEIAGRARRCIVEIQQGPRYDLPMVAIRHLGRKKETRAVELMLSFLPAVSEEPFYDDIMDALTTVGVAGKEVHPAIRKALDEPRLRAAAIQIALRGDDIAIQKQLKSYLNDKDVAVRFHVALHLLRKGDRASVPALIAVIGESPNTVFWQQAEEALYALAGDLAPAVVVKVDDRKEMAAEWTAWWKAKGDQVLFGRKDDYPNDVCIVAETGQTNRVYEWKPEGKPRFDITDLVGPVDSRVLPGKRVLIAEQNGRRISERDFTGKLIWEHSFDSGPVSVMRLPSGNTFVATMQSTFEIRRDGEKVYEYSVDPNTSISDANKLTDGRIAIYTTDDDVVFLASNGRELKRVRVENHGAIEALPNGHVLVSQTGAGRITEFDAKGEQVLDLKIEGAQMATRLPDGNFLVADKSGQKIMKYDRKGNKIYEHSVQGYPHAIHWR